MTLKFFPLNNNRINNENSIGFNTYYDISSNEWKSVTSFQEEPESSSFLVKKSSVDNVLRFEAATLTENGLEWSTSFHIRKDGFAKNSILTNPENKNKGHGILYPPIHITEPEFVLEKYHNGRMLIADAATTIILPYDFSPTPAYIPIGFSCDIMKNGDLSPSQRVKISMLSAQVAIHTGRKYQPYVVFGQHTWRFYDGKRPKLLKWLTIRLTKFTETDWIINFGTVEQTSKD